MSRQRTGDKSGGIQRPYARRGQRLSPTRFSLTGADSDSGASVAEPVRRAAKRKTLYVIIHNDLLGEDGEITYVE